MACLDHQQSVNTCPNGEMIQKERLSLNIFTLNCWGLLGIAKHRSLRIKAIANHLNEQNYDIVFLQEVWVQSDFEYIHSVTKSRLPFAHIYKNSSLLGTPGLALLSKFAPSLVHFEPFATNGSPFRIWHGDWFTGKGVGYALMKVQDYNLHLFCTHTHAQYNDREKLEDQYSMHRLCQMYQLAKFINLNTNYTQHSDYAGKDVVILAGDLNVSPDDLHYKFLLSMTSLHDSCHVYQHQPRNADEDRPPTAQIDFTTCGHPGNTYTLPNTEYVKRIDYIFYRLITKETNNGLYTTTTANINGGDVKKCQIDRIECSTKCSVSGFSFSDHQPVAIRLKVFHNECHPGQKMIVAQEKQLNDVVEETMAKSSFKHIDCQEDEAGSDTSIESDADMKDRPLLMVQEDEEENFTKSDSFRLEMIEIEESNSNRLSIAQLIKNRKPSGNSANESTPSMNKNRTKISSINQSQLNMESIESIYNNRHFYLRTMQDLITSYKTNSTRKKRICFLLMAMLVIILLFYSCVNHFYYSNEIVHTSVLWPLFTVGSILIGMLIIEVNHMFETNSLHWIFHEISISIGPNTELEEID